MYNCYVINSPHYNHNVGRSVMKLQHAMLIYFLVGPNVLSHMHLCACTCMHRRGDMPTGIRKHITTEAILTDASEARR